MGTLLAALASHCIQQPLHLVQVCLESLSALPGQHVRRLWAPANKRLTASDITGGLELLKVEANGAVRCFQSLLKRREIQRPIDLQRSQDTKSDRAVNGRI